MASVNSSLPQLNMKATLAIIAAFVCVFLLAEVNSQLTATEAQQLQQIANGELSVQDRFVSNFEFLIGFLIN